MAVAIGAGIGVGEDTLPADGVAVLVGRENVTAAEVVVDVNAAKVVADTAILLNADGVATAVAVDKGAAGEVVEQYRQPQHSDQPHQLNHSAATFSSQSGGDDVADAQPPKAVKGRGYSVQPAAKKPKTMDVTVFGVASDNEAAKDRSENWNIVLCVWVSKHLYSLASCGETLVCCQLHVCCRCKWGFVTANKPGSLAQRT